MTLFGYDTPQFRQCGIFIHNTDAIPVPAIEPKKPNMLEDILQLLKFMKAHFYISVTIGHPLFQSHLKVILKCRKNVFL